MLEEVRKKLEFYANIDFDEVMFEIYSNEKELQIRIMDLNRIDQLYEKGINAKGKTMGEYIGGIQRPSVTFNTGLTTVSSNPKSPGSNWNFLGAGTLFGSFRFKPLKDGFELDTNEQIKIELRQDVNELVGLTQESLEQLGEIIQPAIIKWLKAA